MDGVSRWGRQRVLVSPRADLLMSRLTYGLCWTPWAFQRVRWAMGAQAGDGVGLQVVGVVITSYSGTL